MTTLNLISQEEYNNMKPVENTYRYPCTKHTKWCFVNKHSEPEYGDRYQKKPMFICCKKNLLKIFKDFHKAAKIFNLDFFLSYGSLLGCVRNNSMIPWDADIDITVNVRDIEKINKVFKLLSIDYKVELKRAISRIYLSNTNCIHLDVYMLYTTNNMYYDVYVRRNKKMLFNHDLIYPLQKAKFEGFDVYIPNKYEEMLTTIYGNRCIELYLSKDNYSITGKDENNSFPKTEVWNNLVEKII